MLVLAVLCFVVCAVRMARERRRLSNGVILLLGLTFGVLWLLTILPGASTLGVVVAFLILIAVPLLLLVFAIAAIVNGVVMTRREGRRFRNILSLIAGVAVIGLAALFVVALLSHVRLFMAAVSSVTLVAAYVAFLFTSFLVYSIVYSRTALTPGMDVIVVLGSGLRGTRVPPLLAGRLDLAAQIYRDERAAGRHPVVIPSGGRGPGEDLPESVAMARYLTDRGMESGSILTEERSTTTRENLRYSNDLMNSVSPGGRMLVVTNNFHAFRAAMLSRDAGISAEVVGSRTASYFLPSATLREFVAIFVRYLWLNVAICVALGVLCFLSLAT